MSRSQLAENTCTAARAIELFGDAWMMMILREMFLGTRRFDDLQRLTGVSPATLSQRLKKLEEVGVVRRESYQDNPTRFEYRLTAMGRDLWPVIVSMKAWGDKWLGSGGAPPVSIVHKQCGATVTPIMVCPDCRAPMAAHDAEPHLSSEFQHERQQAKGQS
jgi:DNA-binding HxlR family transcriptional regulator